MITNNLPRNRLGSLSRILRATCLVSLGIMSRARGADASNASAELFPTYSVSVEGFGFTHPYSDFRVEAPPSPAYYESAGSFFDSPFSVEGFTARAVRCSFSGHRAEQEPALYILEEGVRGLWARPCLVWHADCLSTSSETRFQFAPHIASNRYEIRNQIEGSSRQRDSYFSSHQALFLDPEAIPAGGPVTDSRLAVQTNEVGLRLGYLYLF